MLHYVPSRTSAKYCPGSCGHIHGHEHEDPRSCQTFQVISTHGLLSVALSSAMSLRAHVPPVLLTVTLSCIDTPVFKCRLWMLISLSAYKHDYPNCVVWSNRSTRHSANQVHSDQDNPLDLSNTRSRQPADHTHLTDALLLKRDEGDSSFRCAFLLKYAVSRLAQLGTPFKSG
jgi:hypothetical protein